MTKKKPKTGFVRRQLQSLLHSRYLGLWMVVISFLENTIILAPMEPLYLPAMAARRRSAIFYSGMLTLGCLLGALTTYALAVWAYEPLIVPLLTWLGAVEQMETMRQDIGEEGFWALFMTGVTPIPFQVGTLAAGVAEMPLTQFIAAVGISRGIRYGAVGVLVWWIGGRAEDLIKRYETEMAIGFGILFVVLALGGWLLF